MREYGAAVAQHLADLAGVAPRHLVWITARNRQTGSPESIGFWNGLDAQEFTVGGQTRTYFGAGALLGIEAIIGTVGIEVRRQTVSLSGLTPEVLQAVRAYDIRLAPIEVHRVHIDPEKGRQIGDPVRVLKGTVDEAPIPKAPEGGSATLDLVIASASRALTRTLTAKKSQATQRQIDPTDRGRDYSAISGAVGVFWGTLHKRGAPPPTPRKPLTDEEKGANRK